MNKAPTPAKTLVDLVPRAPRPSRIRREPPAVVKPKELSAYPTERDTWTVIIGVALFAIAIAIITLGMSDFTN